MKNKRSISMFLLTIVCAVGFIALAESAKSAEEDVSMELSENEINSIQETCTNIATEYELQGEDLIAFVDECFADNTMVIDGANLEEPVMDEEPVTESSS